MWTWLSGMHQTSLSNAVSARQCAWSLAKSLPSTVCSPLLRTTWGCYELSAGKRVQIHKCIQMHSIHPNGSKCIQMSPKREYGELFPSYSPSCVKQVVSSFKLGKAPKLLANKAAMKQQRSIVEDTMAMALQRLQGHKNGYHDSHQISRPWSPTPSHQHGFSSKTTLRTPLLCFMSMALFGRHDIFQYLQKPSKYWDTMDGSYKNIFFTSLQSIRRIPHCQVTASGIGSSAVLSGTIGT